MALGAERGEVLRRILLHGLGLAISGILIGAVAAVGLTRLLRAFLYGVSPTDPVTFVAVALVLIGVAGLAAYLPGRRAMRVDPMVALRYE
jgi:putative ABC transport system permease protein